MASSGDVELSVVSSRANLEDKDSSGSDSEEEGVKTNEDVSTTAPQTD